MIKRHGGGQVVAVGSWELVEDAARENETSRQTPSQSILLPASFHAFIRVNARSCGFS